MRHSIVTGFINCVLLMIVFSCLGCESAPAVDNLLYPPPPSARIEQARTAYNSGDYRATMREARLATGSSNWRVRDEAYYLLGMSAHRMGDVGTAEHALRSSARSEEALLSGQSYAELGLLYSTRGQHDAASRAFLAAAPKLYNEDKAQSYYYAGIAEQKLGRSVQARTYLMLASKETRNQSLREQAQQQLAVTGFTLQLGAYASEANAREQAEKFASQAVAARIGAPRVQPSVDRNGRQLYLVQVGRFTTFNSALQYRDQLGAKQAIVAPLTK